MLLQPERRMLKLLIWLAIFDLVNSEVRILALIATFFKTINN